jgi:putative holliday junction resolvase
VRYLALDLGDRRIGVAISDVLGIVARPLEILARTSRERDAEHILGLVQKHGIDCLVVGLPLNMDGTEGNQAAWVRDYTEALSERVGVPAVFWDERLSTERAAEILREQGKTPEKGHLDAVAAAVILQSYLDAHA